MALVHIHHEDDAEVTLISCLQEAQAMVAVMEIMIPEAVRDNIRMLPGIAHFSYYPDGRLKSISLKSRDE